MNTKTDDAKLNPYESCEAYDLLKIFEANQDDDDMISPFTNMSSQCEYIEPSDFGKKVIGNSNIKVSCVHLNCRGLSKNWESLNDLI